jgi:predicted TIM-barrel fold metal-dependent hydrolase
MHIHPTTDEGDMAAMIEQAKRAGIARFIFSHLGVPYVPIVVSRADIEEFNSFAARLRDRYSDWMDMYVYVDGRHPEAPRDVERWVREHGAIAVKIEWARGDGDPLDIDDVAYTPDVVAQATELNVPVKIHTFFRTGGPMHGEVSPLHIVRLAQANPRARLIMAHFGGDWIRTARTVKDYPNIYGDTSGCTWRAGFTERIVAEVGAERVVYGSDPPVRAFGPQIAKILAADFTREQLKQIFYENAERLFYPS